MGKIYHLNLLKRISFFAAITILTSVVSFLLLPILTKYLSPEDYGVLSIFNALIRFIVTFLSLGSINILMVSLIDKKKSFFNLQLRSFFQISITNAILISAGIFIYIVLIGSFFGLPNWLALLSPFIAFGITSFEAISGITVFKKQQKEYSILVLSKFFLEIFISLFLIVGIGLNWIGRVSGLIISLIIVLFLMYRYLKKEKHLDFTLSKEVTKDLIKLGTPLILMNVSITVMNLSDRFFIEKMVGLSDTGIYNVGAVIGSIELIIANAVIAVFRPIIYTCLKEKTTDKKIQLYNLLILAGTLIGIYLFNDLLFFLFVNEKFYSAKEYVFPIALGFLFWGISNYYLSYLIFYKKNTINAFISIFGMVLNLILNYILISKFSTIGASYATAITYFLMAIIIYIVSLKLIDYDKKDI